MQVDGKGFGVNASVGHSCLIIEIFVRYLKIESLNTNTI